MTDATPHVFVWDITEGACGASRSRENALAIVGTELAKAEIGTVAAVVEVQLSDYGISYIPVSLVARALRTDLGLVWTEMAAVAEETR